MLKFLVDENLPYYFGLFHNENFIHVFDIPEVSSDEEIWNYAKEKELIIITKDADFSNKILFSEPPPKVIHLRIGNLKISELHVFMNRTWATILIEIEKNKLVNVYADRIESFE